MNVNSYFAAPGMARAIAHEIAEMLASVASGGTGGLIDLRSLPMAPEERTELRDLLGEGEVTCTLTVTGRSEIRETGHAGVWWITHFDTTDKPQSEQIEVGRIPSILLADPADMGRASAALTDTLSPDQGDPDGRA